MPISILKKKTKISPIDKYKKRLLLLKLIIFKYSKEFRISALVSPSVKTKPTIGPTNPIPTISRIDTMRIRKYIKARLPNAGISRIEISRSSKTVTVTIHTARPGIVIGKGGEEVNRLKDEIKQLTEKNIQLNISEVKRPELDAALVGSNIAHQLQKKVSYRRVVNKVIQSTMRMGAEGIRINVAGRLGGVEIARSENTLMVVFLFTLLELI